MVTLYSPLSPGTRPLSSRDPVALSRVIRFEYPEPITSLLVEVMMLAPLKRQLTEMKGLAGGASVVGNLTAPPTAPLRGPAGNTFSPVHTPEGRQGHTPGV